MFTFLSTPTNEEARPLITLPPPALIYSASHPLTDDQIPEFVVFLAVEHSPMAKNGGGEKWCSVGINLWDGFVMTSIINYLDNI